MKKCMLAVCTFFLLGVVELHAQSTGDISGKYLVPKGPSIVEIVHEGHGYRVTQISTPVAYSNYKVKQTNIDGRLSIGSRSSEGSDRRLLENGWPRHRRKAFRAEQ